MRARQYAIGVDYGTNSCRALLVDTATGREVASSVFPYPRGEAGILLDKKDPNVARQAPGDYIAGFITTVANVVAEAKKKEPGFDPEAVAGIGVDTTGSTVIPVNEDGVPLAMTKKFERHPAAQAWLWKDHTAWEEAAWITETARKAKAPYLTKCGGVYSSEWFWSKVWHCERSAPEVFEAAASWVEACDFIPAFITGGLSPKNMARSVCAAGHKAMYAAAWGGLPAEKFLKKLSPGMAELRGRLYGPGQVKASDQIAGFLAGEVAKAVGLPQGVPVAVGAFDAHHGAVGAGVGAGRLVKIMGTSSCDMMVADKAPDEIPGICGMVPGSILPGMVGLEAGQSAVGDIFLWFARHAATAEFRGKSDGETIDKLTRACAKNPPGHSGLVALDWHNGNRTVLVDPLLSGMMLGQTLHTTAPEQFRAVMEATAFGSLTIIRRFGEHGVKVDDIVASGGLAEKMPVLMQIYADVCGRPMKVCASKQTCALGAALFGAVAGGVYPTAQAAQKKMSAKTSRAYAPNPEAAKTYAELYALYETLHDAFGGRGGDVSRVMKKLIALRRKARGQ
ncbi:MAG: ribulokinase [Kiritimatiellaeota bacterium]|nr:ribulokinase [Kiritimatiellota bacterium]